MKSGVPWSIRGIDDEIREAARVAARRSGLSVSEWLNDLIAKQAAADRASAPEDDDQDDDDDVEASAVADAVERLTRRIRAMDENSRSALSGLQGRLDEIETRLGAASGRRDAGRSNSLKGVASIVDQLSRDIDNTDETARSSIEGLRARAGRVTRDAGRDSGLERVSTAIRDLDARLTSIARPKPQPAEDPSTKLDTIKARLDSLLAQGADKPSGRAAALDATLQSLEAHIDQAKTRLAAARPAAQAPRPTRSAGSDLASVIAEISARQRSIDEIDEPRSIRREDSRHDGDAVVAAVAALRADIAALADGFAAPHRGEAERDALVELADRIETLTAALPGERDLLRRMHDEFGELRSAIDSAGLDRLADGLSELTGRLPDRDRLDVLGSEIGSVRRALEAADSPRAIARLEMRVAELARGIEAALSTANAAAMRGGGSDAVARLESRIDDIAGRIDAFLGRTSPNDALSALQDRFAEVLDRIERLDSGRRDPAAALDDIKAEIGAVRRDIAGQKPVRVDHIENQIAELARRLDTATTSAGDGQGIAELEAQVAHLASEIERSMPRTQTLKQVEENLAQLQRYLTDNRGESVEAARLAAREAVRDMAAPAGDSPLVRALKDDLENIRSAAGEADTRTKETLGSVHETLARVVDRLTKLEQDSTEPEALSMREPARATGTYGVEAPLRAEAPSLLPAVRATPRPPQDHRPLEPGSGKPDLAALRELARSATSGDHDKKSDRKADFIAAARRAAQAAAAEAATEMDGEEEAVEEKQSTFARIGQAIRNRKRPLLLAAAALVLAISAIQYFGDRDGQHQARAAAPAPVALRAAPPPLPMLVAALPASADVAMPRISNAAMVPPTADPGAAIAFAAPEQFDSRFGDEPVAPSPSAFERAEAAPSAPAVAATEAPALVASQAASQAEPAIGPARLRQAAAAGDPAAAFEVAARYAEGNGTRPDLAMAADWYRKAAESGLAVAQYRLGSLYERGQGVKKDLATAVVWYQHAADQGNVGAMHNLAVMMSQGVDGAPDQNKAFEWFLAAANYGIKDSQYNLGVLYARGLGTPQDLVESYKWFAVAAAPGDKDAGVRRDEVAKALSPDDLTRARATTTAWRATPVITEANTAATPAGGWKDATAGVTEADGSALVKKIQTLLAEQGYDPGPADGFEGPKTTEAVRAFQRTIGLSETGQISADLATALATPST